MASVEVMISGVLWDKATKSGRAVALIGEASLSGVGVGGGPIIPGEQPPGIWDPVFPSPPIANVPGAPGYNPPGIWPSPGPLPHPEHPIVIPPDQVPPGMKPPVPPQPGDPTTIVPPPQGQAGWPVNPITPPAYMVFNYPGIGPVYVAPPVAPPAPTPQSKK